jgi:hypothetical protein
MGVWDRAHAIEARWHLRGKAIPAPAPRGRAALWQQQRVRANKATSWQAAVTHPGPGGV